ncbi:pyroglutamyl-peptidase 1 [Fopius arisanus]|uniref:Pyroglutamyl-peptidase 1 n=1 Tax=Fopius arisanus TaxID=64838 RepID=A0A9R1TST7_9HYME|nr:PREDICTED: pyroglutamyl-peptidase 1 [Fopius arisanus]
MTEKRKIVVTGFGPFTGHTVNASWEAAKLLKDKYSGELNNRYNIDLIIEEIPVVYNHVSSRIPEIWKEHNPLFIVHLGVSHKAKCLTIESGACSSGYTRKDVVEKCPSDSEMTCTRLDVGFDVNEICRIVGNEYDCVACVSNDAGRYLCEFTLYQSLLIKPHRTLFIHVPDFDVYSANENARGIFSIICCATENLEKAH